jgi:hypothetical protein
MSNDTYDQINIYYLDHNPTLAAEALCDTHVRHLAGPLTQLLANVYYIEGATLPAPAGYRPELLSHPCATWATEDFKHWNWLLMHVWGIAREAEARFGATLPVVPALRYMNTNLPIGWLTQKNFWDPPMVMAPEFKAPRLTGALACYRAFYRDGRRHMHRWTNRPPPLWLMETGAATAAADKLVEAVELELVDPDRHRAALYPGLDDREWEEVKRRATEMVNGLLEEEDGRSERLVDVSDIALVEPDALRLAGLSEAEWILVKHIATEQVNGHDILAQQAGR